MKKFKLLSAIALAGLVGLTARAATPVNFDLVSVKLTALFQTNNTESSSKIVKVKIVNKDVLNLIAGEFTNKAAQITGKGAKLVVNDFFDGTFAVLDKTNGVIVANASVSTNDDSYELFTEEDGNSVDAFKDTSSKETDDIVAVGRFQFDNAADTMFGEIIGPATVKETFSTKDSESFKLTGTDDVEINGHEGVLTGTVKGVGKNNDSFD